MKKSFLVYSLCLIFIAAATGLYAWTPLKRITYNSGDSRMPKVVTTSTNFIGLAWSDMTFGYEEILLRGSHDGGTSWGELGRLTWTPGYSEYPDATIDSSDNPHIVWNDDLSGNYEIYFKNSLDGGENWSTVKRLTYTSGSSLEAVISAGAANNIHCAWYDDSTGVCEIYYKRSTDSGTTWLAPKRLTWTPRHSKHPAIASDGSGNVYIVWDENLSGNEDIFFKKSTDSGSTWGVPQRLTWDGYVTRKPDLCIDGSGHLHLIYENYWPGDAELFYKKSTDGGSTWGAVVRLTWNSGSSLRPAIAADSSGHVKAVWHDDSPGNYEIYYKQSTDSGVTWGGLTRLCWNSEMSWDPDIHIDSAGNTHVVWSNDWGTNKEIFYKKD